MWADLQNAAQNGHPITGILNPNSGPNTDEGSLCVYLDILANFMNKGDSANAPDIIPPKVWRFMDGKMRSRKAGVSIPKCLVSRLIVRAFPVGARYCRRARW